MKFLVVPDVDGVRDYTVREANSGAEAARQEADAEFHGREPGVWEDGDELSVTVWGPGEFVDECPLECELGESFTFYSGVKSTAKEAADMSRVYRTIEFPRGFANEFRIVEHTSKRERDQYIADSPDNDANRRPRPITAADARKRGVSEF